MKFVGRLNQWKIGLLLLVLFIMPSISFGDQQTAIESGQYFQDEVYYSISNAWFTPVDYMFFAEPAETVIIRVANESLYDYDFAPQCFIYAPPDGTGTNLASSTDALFCNEVQLTNLTSYGWYRIRVTHTNALHYYSHSFSVSFLRLPDAPLSYADTDVGTMHSAESLSGTINVGADLDAGTFAVSSNCTVQIRMGQEEVLLVPDIQLFDPSGNVVSNAFPQEYRAEMTCRLAQTGIYTLVCNDKFNASGPYALSMVQIPGIHTNTSDLDLGTIIPGETLIGTLDKPGDLDVATYTVFTNDVVKLTMSEIDSEVNPVMELYDPSGIQLARATDPLQVAVVITNTTTTNGTYTVICKDAEDRYDVRYSLTLALLSGPSSNSMPDVPTGLSASDGTYSNRILVTWDSAGGATGYDLWRSYSTNADIQLCTNYTSTIYEDYNVLTNVVYYYKLRSRNAYGTSALSDSDSGYCGLSAADVERRALVVGIDHYDPSYGAGDLSGCTNDANGIRDTFMLGDPSNRWQSANIQVLTDRQATRSTIRGVLNSLASSSGAGDMVVYFQSSHGGQSPGTNPSNTFVCTYDADYTDADLAADLALFHPEAKIFVIIDTCYSAGMFKDSGSVLEWPFAERTIAEYRKIKQAQLKAKGLPVPKTLGQNIAFMTACDYNEFSWEYNNRGLYSGYLTQGCTISSVDTNNDGEYQFLELHNYAATNALQIQPTQHAQTYNPMLLASAIARGVGSNIIVTAAGLDNDYDGDGSSDLAVYHEATGQWYITSLQRGLIAWAFAWGGPGLLPVTGDYDGDNKADLAVYNESSGQWYIWSLQEGLIAWAVSWGGLGVTPVAGDYTGDGKADLVLYDKTAGYWYGITLAGDVIILGTSWTGSGFVAVPGDYDDDRLSDYAMYHEEMGYWYIKSVYGASIVWGLPWGGGGYIPVPGDYDGDRISDMAVYHEDTGLWFIWSQAKQSNIAWGTSWGGDGFTPVQGDYNDDGVADLAVYHQATGSWFIRSVSGGSIAAGLTFGGPDFIPVKPTW